jgi:hypothetical protein
MAVAIKGDEIIRDFVGHAFIVGDLLPGVQCCAPGPAYFLRRAMGGRIIGCNACLVRIDPDSDIKAEGKRVMEAA